MKGLNAWIERHFPCPFERGHPVLVSFGVLSALVYIYTRIWYQGEFRNLPENMMALTFLVSAWGQRHRLKSDLIFKLLILAIVIPLLLYGVNALADYQTAYKYRSLNDLLKLFFFLPLAWWMGGSRAGAIKMLTIAFLGLLTAVLLDPNLMKSVDLLWSGQRVDFDIHNAQHGAVFFGLTVLFCLLSFALFQISAVSFWVKLLLIAACLIGLAGLIGTQTRAAFLALLVCGLVAIARGAWQRILFNNNRLAVTRYLLVSIILIGLIGWLGIASLEKRIVSEKTSFHTLFDGNLDALPFSSTGIRVHSWAESLKWIVERPITGWGRKARIDVIQQADRFPDDIKSRYGHLHNSYLEMLLGFGAVGLVYFIILWSVLLKRIRFAASKELYVFALYGSGFFLLMNFFESLLFYWSGVFAISLIMAGGYSQYLARSLGGSPMERAQEVFDEV